MGQLDEFLLAIMKMSLMQKRLNFRGQKVANLYKSVEMEILSEEYLPDDYNASSTGPVAKAIGKHIKSFKI